MHLPPQSVLEAYGLADADVSPLGTGNINHTFRVDTTNDSFVLQAISPTVFPNPAIIDCNLQRIREHLTRTAPHYFLPLPLPNQTGATLTYDAHGTAWRLLPYVTQSTVYNVAPSAAHAYAAARAFAELSCLLSTLPVGALATPLPDFHNLSLRYEQYQRALTVAPKERRQTAEVVIRGLSEFEYIHTRYTKQLAEKCWQQRIYHHDTKLNNILFKTDGPDVLAIIDLDTIMPGYAFSDVGDLVMFGCSVFEDETDHTKIIINQENYDAIITGYRDGSGSALTPTEQSLLPTAPLCMCYMLALRFLTDYLQGETYFKTTYAGQNLDKAHNRLILLRALAAQTERI